MHVARSKFSWPTNGETEMPLKQGKSQKVISSNIGEMIRKYKETGSIGTSKPKNRGDAIKQAAAIAYSTAGKSRKYKAGSKPAGVQGPFMTVKIY
jgi:hypothetical protein